MPVLAILIVIALVYHFAGVAGLILLAIASVLFLLRGTRARRHNPAPQPPNTHGRRR